MLIIFQRKAQKARTANIRRVSIYVQIYNYIHLYLYLILDGGF